MSINIRLDGISKLYNINPSVGEELVSALSVDKADARINDTKTVIDNLSLTITEGERLGIVGRNGAGKSTLLHIISGITEPTSGKVSINGKVTAIMTLGLGLRDDLSGRENIYVDGEIQGKSRGETDKNISEIIEFAELGDFIDYPVRTYSTGMKARLAFSMITHISPEILIIDEALSVGDATFSAKAGKRIKEICANGKIVILVSHGLSSIREICNRCIYLKNGQIVLDGTPDEVTKAYSDEVYKEDEAELLTRFSSHTGNRSFKSGCDIYDVKFLSDNNVESSLKVPTRKDLNIQIFAHVSDAINNDNYLKIEIVRLDSLVLFSEEFYINNLTDALGALCFQLSFNPLLLAAGIFKLNIDLICKSNHCCEMLAQSTTIFEVYSNTLTSGGEPMLYYPISGRVINSNS